MSYDRFHNNADNLYLVLRDEGNQLSAPTSKLLGPTIKREVAEIKDTVSYTSLPNAYTPYFKRGLFGSKEKTALTESQFFELFSFPAEKGAVKDLLKSPTDIVLSKKISRKFFGDEDPIGKTLDLVLMGKTTQMTVSAVLQDLPNNTHLKNEVFINIDFVERFGINWNSWTNQSVNTYLLSNQSVDTGLLEEKITKTRNRHHASDSLKYSIIPISDIHLHTANVSHLQSSGNILFVYLFISIAAIILIIACMNYINLSSTMCYKRSKEIAVQKVVGARQRELLGQYIGETIIIVTFAMVLALVFLEAALPAINAGLGMELNIDYSNCISELFFLLTIILTSFISCFFPGFALLRMSILDSLKGNPGKKENSFPIRSALITFQFSVSILILIATSFVYKQMLFVKNSDLGYDESNILTIDIQGDIQSSYEVFREKLLKFPSIMNVCRSEQMNSDALAFTNSVKIDGEKMRSGFQIYFVDGDFADTYGIEIKKGEFLDSKKENKVTFVLNEAAEKVTLSDNPLGKELNLWGSKGAIMGVSNNFHFSSLHNKVDPLIMAFPKKEEIGIRFRQISIRIAPSNTSKSIKHIEKTWRSVFPDMPFAFEFFDDQLSKRYKTDNELGTMFFLFSMLAVFIACMGLYGLTAFSVEQRSKEIGLHKIVGATVFDIISLISKRYLRLILLSNVMVWPIAFWLIQKWLENFAYRTPLSLFPFLTSSGFIFLIALGTMSIETSRAATANPAKTLRYE